MLVEGESSVGVGGVDVVGVEDGDAVGLHEGAKALAVANEEGGVEREVTHGRDDSKIWVEKGMKKWGREFLTSNGESRTFGEGE